ncbi:MULTISPECIES: carbohydrate ABC transporter permease [unclassified Paenibacillus]|uniref:carbohydrate ABC transporter permease n=1 Tax=unclassified Paenibacillus TaxID=185978 RepID=UPI00104915FB|nr:MULTISPECIES: carbohydrate ABC transporter permease [unclassified Paenibacillus]NIK69585.1 putative aldouronate transport system permease protein [Paenibacillus sp. BK720]TCM95762.1 putative aldouronate transport system permease protein [Paenibacillus sp. BK033]
MYQKTFGYRAFSVFNYVLLSLAGLLCIIPIIHILAISFSASAPANAHLVGMWPVDFNTESYTKTMNNPNFLRAFWISIGRTALGASITLAVITLGGYALSKDNTAFKARSRYAWYFVFTMWFSGGIVPLYIVIRNLHMMNTIWALVLPGSVAVFNMILLMNFFRATPKELEEAAFIDGAGHFSILFRVYLPLAMPAIATMSLFTIVGNWNAWFDALLYINDYRNYPLATFLQTVIVQQDFSKLNPDVNELKNISQRTVKAAQIFIGMLPVLVVYPFLQRFFVKGIVLGAVKE